MTRWGACPETWFSPLGAHQPWRLLCWGADPGLRAPPLQRAAGVRGRQQGPREPRLWQWDQEDAHDSGARAVALYLAFVGLRFIVYASARWQVYRGGKKVAEHIAAEGGLSALEKARPGCRSMALRTRQRFVFA